MARATRDLILEIVYDDCEIDAAKTFNREILSAEQLLNMLKCAEATRDDGTLWHDEASLTTVEVYLAAHFMTVYDPMTESESASGGSASWQRPPTDFYLDGSSYGQTAIIMDPSGCLAKYNQELKEGDARKATYRLYNLIENC